MGAAFQFTVKRDINRVKINLRKTTNGLPLNLVSDKWLKEYEKTGKGWLRILSDSIAPRIQTGDQILIAQVAPSNIHIGDIITFWRNNLLVTHRVVRKVREEGDVYFIERGDRYSQHSLIDPQSLMGKVLQIKKDEKCYMLDAIPWQIFNRIVGIAIYCAFTTRLISSKVPFIPRPLKNIMNRVYKLFALISDKILRVILLRSK